MSESVSFDDLFRSVANDDGLETIKGSSAHHVTDSLLLDSESLDLKNILFDHLIDSANGHMIEIHFVK